MHFLNAIFVHFLNVVDMNFFNVVLTSINTRKREFAMLQSVGMNGKQLKSMLIFESLCYIAFTLIATFLIVVVCLPMVERVFGGMFWFYQSNFTAIPLLSVMVLLVVIGAFVPLVIYRHLIKQSIVERLREIG